MFDEKLIKETISFHGHKCNGLALGIRASDYVINNFYDPGKSGDLITVTETNMCAVDAFQYFLGSTFGKGNLLLIDYGKKAFSFFNRNTKEGIRLIAKDAKLSESNRSITDFRNIMERRELNSEEKQRYQGLIEKSFREIINSNFEDTFQISDVQIDCPDRARIFESIECSECGESMMETRVRRYKGKNLCIPCFDKLDSLRQK